MPLTVEINKYIKKASWVLAELFKIINNNNNSPCIWYICQDQRWPTFLNHVKELLLVLAFNIDVEMFAGFKCPVFVHPHVVW